MSEDLRARINKVQARTLLHVSERWITEAVGAEGVALAPGPRGPQHQLKVIQWTAQLLVQLDGSVLGKAVGLITVGAVEPAGLGLETQRTCWSFLLDGRTHGRTERRLLLWTTMMTSS